MSDEEGHCKLRVSPLLLGLRLGPRASATHRDFALWLLSSFSVASTRPGFPPQQALIRR